jgi:hypothetical protein
MKQTALQKAFSGYRLVMIYVMTVVVMTVAVKMTVVNQMVNVLELIVHFVMVLILQKTSLIVELIAKEK